MPEYRPGAIINTTQSEQCHAFPNRTRLSINILLRFLRSPPPLMAVWKPCIIRSVLLILLNSRTSKLQLQPDLTTIRESQPLENPQMTTNRESQSPISALDSETRVTATDFLVFALSLCGNLSTLPLIANVRKSPYFKPFSRYLPHFLDSRTTVSTCPV